MKHGRTGYRRGCRCEICTKANRDYHRDWQWDRRHTGKRMTSNAETLAHVEYLRRAGMSDRTIEEAAGISRGVIYHTRRQQLIKVATSEAILSVTPSDRPAGHFTDAKQAVRMVREMQRSAGLTLAEVDAMLGRQRGWASVMVRQARIYTTTHMRVSILYELLARQGRVPAKVLAEVMR
jgi:hypothetical protein